MLISDLCRRYTDMNPRHMVLLDRMSAVFPFLADLIYGGVKFYIPTRERRSDGQPEAFIVAADEQPHTVYMPPAESLLGRRVAAIEEPFVQKSYMTGEPCHGRRELTYGFFIDMTTYAVCDGGEVLGVLSFEVDVDRLKIRDYQVLPRAAIDVIEAARRGVDPAEFAPLSSSDGIIVTDHLNRIIFSNSSAHRIYRVLGIGSLRGRHIFDRLLTQHVTRETVEAGKPWRREQEAGGLILVRRDIALQTGGHLVRRIVILSDVTEIRARDKEIRIKSAVIQEIHHRVKNNLQTIASLLRLQARRCRSEEARNALQASMGRVLSISVVHDFLARQGKEAINVEAVLREIFRLLSTGMSSDDFILRLEYNGPSVVLPSRYASSLALVINELMINAIEHAFEERPSGTVGLNVSDEGDSYELDFFDDGNGLEDDFDMRRTRSLGLSIVRTLVEGDLGGTFALENDTRAGHGTHARLQIPKPADSEFGPTVQSLQEK